MNSIKSFYKNHPDKINEKRASSPYLLRRYAHEQQYSSILQYVKPGMKVLDAGCGEGTLSVLIAKKGALVTGVDISEPNVKAAQKYALDVGVKVDFVTGDSERFYFEDNSFDLVVSSHVLEHLPDFDKGLREVMRVTKKRAVVAIPTVYNACSLVQVGGGMFWLKGKRMFTALPYGFLRLIKAIICNQEGVNETYGGADVPHIFRFPSVMRKKIKRNGYRLIEQEASSLSLPYFESLFPFVKFMDKYKKKPVLRNMGYGTTFVIEK